MLGRLFAVTIAICFIVLMGFMIGGWWLTSGHGADLAAVAQIKPGMTQQQVEDLLGQPHSITVGTMSQDGQSWYFTRWTWCIIGVHFSSDGKVTDVVHDH